MNIYKITNISNGKVYIGQSIRPISERFQRHINDAINNNLDTHLARAIRKYGKGNFIIELIDTANTQNELNEKEQFWIRFFDSINNGYNETDAIYKCGGNTYQSKSEDEMIIISDKIRQSKLGSNNPMARTIKCLNIATNEELFFQTVKDCQSYFNEPHHRFITTRVTKQTRSLYLGIWAISYFENSYEYEINVSKTGNRVRVVDVLYSIDIILNSMNETDRFFNFQIGTIKQMVHENGKEFYIGSTKIIILD